jgi:hypothetical protein
LAFLTSVISPYYIVISGSLRGTQAALITKIHIACPSKSKAS